MNQINIIAPYLWNGVLVFDDPKVGLDREPFIMGADIALMTVAQFVGVDSSSFILIFSAQKFPGYQAVADWIREGEGGNWYRVSFGENSAEGWLCPALLKYFESAPQQIFFQIKPKEVAHDVAVENPKGCQ